MSGNGDYISREAAVELLSQPITMSMCLSVEECHHKIAQQRIDRYLVENIPAADVRPVVRGKWEDVEVTYVADKTTLPFERISSMRCNQCNRYHTEIYYYGNPTEMANFCPNCGAQMEES